MLKIDGYQILSPIYESLNSIVYQGIKLHDNQPVILKTLKQDYPTPQEITRYKQEYQIISQLNIPGVIKAYKYQEVQRNPMIILEDFGGRSLKMSIEHNSPLLWTGITIPNFLNIAIQIAEILGQIHSHNIIHKDINPANIIFNSETREVKIIDFGISTQLTRENPTLKNPNVLEGTLAYISPEQTGRMNRALDYRTDFYSLGVTFYELLTGNLPFETDDTLELVHCHIAKQPIPPKEVKSDEIPPMISDIVMKLMAKTAEDRYQSAWGLKADLEECFVQWETTGKIETFPLGMQDISDKFQIPQKLYGREEEVETLLAAFERVAGAGSSPQPHSNRGVSSGSPLGKGGMEMMLVAGYSGIGKSALVQELYKPITQARGYFISGKFDQFQRNIPYSAVVSAFQELVRQLLTETETQLNLWRAKILSAIGVNGQIIIDVIPEVELIIGKQPKLPQLGATEAQNRFNLVLGNFIRAFCSPENPLVIFLDDLQWADAATLKLIQLMMTDTDTQYLFLIGAYRDNEVSPTHPLMMTLEEIKKASSPTESLEEQEIDQPTVTKINQINLAPLGVENISQLMADTLYSNTDMVKHLAEIVVIKTRGNPFFVNEFLTTLYAEGLLNLPAPQYSLKGKNRGCWQWDVSQIEALGITDNVVELMIGKLKKMPESTQNILQLAACIGSEFDLNTLTVVCEKRATTVFDDLRDAVQSGLILSCSELDEQLLIQDYEFRHDRIQQAAYALIDDSQKKSIHLQIGRLLLQNTSQEARSEKIFTIVDHLNMGRELIRDDAEREYLAQLNLLAGSKATSATAYAAAVNYLQVAIKLLAEDSWQTQYPLTLDIYSRAVEAVYLNGDLPQMEQLAEIVFQHANTVLDKMKVYQIKIQSFIPQSKFLDAVNTALPVLEILGISFPPSPTPADIQQGLEELLSNLADKQIEDLIDLPEMTDPDKLAAMAIASSIFSASYITAPSLLPLLVFKQVNLSLQYGNTPLSAVAYVYLGLLLCGIFGDIERGYQFGQLALKVLDRFHAQEHLAKVMVVFNATIRIWKEPIHSSVPHFQTAYQIGLDVGDFEYAANCSYLTALHSMFSGKNIEELEPKIAAYSESLVKLKQQTYLYYGKIYHQSILNLLGRTENPYRLMGEVYNAEVLLPVHIEANDRYAVFCVSVNKLHLSYLFQEYDFALQNAVMAEQYLDGATSTLLFHIFYFYDSLTRLALYPLAPLKEQKNILEKVAANQEKMKKWAHHAPRNYLHKYYLVEAEKFRVLSSKHEAIDNYDRAIELASEEGFLNDEALANELAGKFYLTQGKEKFALVHLWEAYYCYRRWGATAKVKDLEKRYPELVAKSSGISKITTAPGQTTRATTNKSSVNLLDLATVIKASQTIGSEILIEQLLQKLMKILIENAGAQRGFLLLEDKGKLLVEAEGAIDSEQVTVLQSIPMENCLPLSIINYVARTYENVVLNNATIEGNFMNDRYIQEHQPKSILCVPLMDRGKLVSIVYMENNLTPNAFTPDRLEVLKILSSQAAISIENARLYQTLDDKVKERTTQLAQANQEITALNSRLKAENLRMGAELEVTKKLQYMILPKTEELESIEGLEIAGFMEPADEVGGDYYDVLQQDGRVKISIGDVTGHGLESGVLMIMAQTAVRTLKESNETDPVKFLDIINRTLYGNIQRMNSDKNMTLVLLNYAEGMLSMSGQHEELIVVRNSGIVEMIDTIELGFPIGLEEDIADFISQKTVQLNSGDVVVLYTDGITEAENINKEFYGLERLCDVVEENRHKSAEEIKQIVIDDVRQHIGSQKVFDDITLVVLKQK
jgi:predicted ATPase/serine phosphatase RsbU (regulator of sigma subunit)/tRNA A-37 threonylcarbamoyl transferase component Bud32